MLALLDLTACFVYVRFQTLPVKSILRADFFLVLSFHAREEQRLHFEQQLQAAFCIRASRLCKLQEAYGHFPISKGFMETHSTIGVTIFLWVPGCVYPLLKCSLSVLWKTGVERVEAC